jgi:hypothetical protein
MHKNEEPASANVSAIEQFVTQVSSDDTWLSLQIAATFFDAIKQSNTKTVATSDVVPSNIEHLREADPLVKLPRLFAVGNVDGVEFSCLFDTACLFVCPHDLGFTGI